MTVKSELARQREKETWTQVRVEIALMREVDKIIEGVHVFGARKYWSRNDFVKDAVLRLLQEYQTTRSQSQTTTAAAAKKGKEEILVAGREK
jgi:metal-responsive CopG/Arc/MetJ family transcriptional regulator